MTSFARSRIGTLLAVVPLGAWTLVHLWNNLYAFEGASAWQKAVTEYPHPIAYGVTLAVVLGPLLYHTVWGLGRIAIARPNVAEYPSYANWKFLLQRLSALGVLLFIGAHLWLAMLKPRLFEGHAEPFDDIAHEMHGHEPTLIVYTLGVVGIAYHLANGLQTAAMKLGMRWPRRMTERLEWPFLLFGLCVLGLGWGAIYALYRAGQAGG